MQSFMVGRQTATMLLPLGSGSNVVTVYEGFDLLSNGIYVKGKRAVSGEAVHLYAAEFTLARRICNRPRTIRVDCCFG